MKFKIQLVLVNAAPADIIQLDIEKRQIQDKLSNAAIIFDSPAARITDVITALRKHKPDVVHFSAHGFQDEIVLLNDDNKAKPIPRVALAKLFEQYKDKNKIRLVVLNACYSARQAQAIKKFVD